MKIEDIKVGMQVRTLKGKTENGEVECFENGKVRVVFNDWNEEKDEDYEDCWWGCLFEANELEKLK